jgi:metallo-beta-lactamase family protein
MLRLKFLGANRQVTGSCYFLETEDLHVLIDCGLFQERDYLGRNWEPFPVPPEKIDILLLSHVHLDHSGLIPKLVREGFKGPILVTHPSKAMLPIVLLDSARIQEEDAAYKRKRHKREGRKGPYPEIPLYTVEDAERVLSLVKDKPYRKPIPLNGQWEARFHDAGHILGSAIVEVTVRDNGRQATVLFSGDIGQWNRPLMRDPTVFDHADYVVMETTYGDREHEDPAAVDRMLCEIINETIARGGNIVIPTFAIERTQELLFHLGRLVRQNKIPFLMTFLDSPMAVDITEVFLQHQEYLDSETLELIHAGKNPFEFPGLRLTRTVAESKSINSIRGSCIIMAGSGMCTGGRIKHHLIQNISRPESTILFVGYQAQGTLGRQILDGKPEVRILGQHCSVRARVAQIQGFSAHAGRKDLLRWLDSFRTPPARLFLTHGEVEASRSLSDFIQSKKGWTVTIPDYLEDWEL